ncbi:MAG: hypothetical protein AB7O67_07070 [Vicinamibacterales bacterium]
MIGVRSCPLDVTYRTVAFGVCVLAVIGAGHRPAVAPAGQPVTPEVCRAAVRETFGPLLPYPAATRTNVPEDGTAGARWIVRWAPVDEMPLAIEVLANPYNVDNQLRAERDMAAIREAVFGAEQRAQAEYERLLDEVRRTGKAADVDGVTLDDEGVIGERADADAHVEIACLMGADTDALGSAVAPSVAPGPDGGWMLRVPAHEYTERTDAGDTRRRFRPAEVRLYAGLPSAPVVSRRGDRDLFDLAVAGAPAPEGAVTVILRGNEALVGELAAAADWARLSALHRR